MFFRNQSRRGTLWISSAIFIITVGCVYWLVRWESADKLLEHARLALFRKDFSEAERLARRCIQISPESTTAFHIAGEAAALQGKFVAAVGDFDRMPNDGSSDYADGLVMASKIWLWKLYRMSEAEIRLRRALESDVHHSAANQEMYYLLMASARWREATSYNLELMKQGRFSHSQLVDLGNEDRLYEQYKAPPTLRQWYLTDRNQPAVLLGMAQAAINRDDNVRAKSLLQRAVNISPDFIAAQSRLGTVMLDGSSAEEFLAWHGQLPTQADADPDIWVTRGKWAQKKDDSQVAIRCFWEAVRRDPNSRTAIYQLSRLLISHGHHERAASFLNRFEDLQALRKLEEQLSHGRLSFVLLRKTAERMESLGRVWEAWGWCRVALDRNRDLTWAQKQVRQLRQVLAAGPPLTLAAANPALQVDLSDFPLPNWGTAPTTTRQRGPANIGEDSVSFQDMAAATGLNFTFFHSPSAGVLGHRMYEFTGGGVAVLDYDADGWPDIYLTQGCSWPPEENQREHLDRLFRNRGDGTFDDVTEHAGLAENRFSQGATVGDFNNDGFPDLFVGNIGRNRLYRNNGDGTFRDVTDNAGIDGNRWTTSCLLCDLNGDTLPDLYAVNYLEGDNVYSRICKDSKDQPRTCRPSQFRGTQDQFYLNLGNGRFDEVAAKAGFEASNGKGLGIVAADFDGSEKLSLFIANDSVANFYFRNQTPQPGGFPTFVEQAYPTGLALNVDGYAEGCMGIAVGDCNNDKRLDLFVTNFLTESNTLYLQSAGGLFSDATAEAGLVHDSLPMLGFGAQFLDGELDGHLDLILTNGNVEDVHGIRFQMPPQYFRNIGTGRFQQSSHRTLGTYFKGQYLGRGLARVDWNRDGREDFVISHLNAPVALLTNTTADRGHFIAVKLRGTKSNRDAIGTTVIVRTKKRTIVRQLTAGDGYHASNQRMLVFGLGDESRIDRMEIRWPSGLQQKFDDFPADRELMFIEDGAEPVAMQSSVVSSAGR